MKRRTCHLLLCWGIAGLATAGLAGESNTNSGGVSEAGAPQAAASQPAPADAGAASKAGASPRTPQQPADTSAAPAAAVSQPAPADLRAAGATPQPAGATPQPLPTTDTNSNLPPILPINPMPQPLPTADTNSNLADGGEDAASTAEFEAALEMARQQRHDKILVGAAQILEGILKSNAPPVLQRQALFELALVMQDDEQMAKAQQIWSQYLHLYSDDPTIPDVLLRQGLLYRKMGVDAFAVSKFYAVMSSALKLKLENLAYYKKLVVQAQTEIADTYYLDAKFAESADFFNRIIKSGDGEAGREQLEWKLIRSLSYLTNHAETVSKAQAFLTRFPKSSNVPEVRFLLASALQKMGRNPDALEQVLLLLQSQQENAGKDPETWAYWQRRAGNEIANQLYKEGDFADALEIYLGLAELDKSPVWQVPVFYQVGMVYEQLQQWQKAADTYTGILDRQKELSSTNTTPTLASLLEMAQWRKDYIAWMQKAKWNDLALRPQPSAGAPGAGPHLK